MILSKLFNKTKTNTLVEWSIEVDGEKYRTITGKLDGNLIISAWTVCEGKNVGKTNETSPKQQALKEANAKIIKKKEEGYVDDVDLLTNRDCQVQEIVMLAKNYKDFQQNISDDEDLYVQPKLDGVRCKGTKDMLLSRKNKPYISTPHILQEIKIIQNLDFALDGELYNHQYKDDFNSIISLVRKTKPTTEDLLQSEKYIQYHLYDIQTNDIFSARYQKLQLLFLKYNFKNIKLVPTFKIKKSQINEYHEKFVNEGYEGIIIRRNKPYEYFRSKNLLKLKFWQDAEFKILDILEGTGNRSGMMGKIVLEIKPGFNFDCNAKGNYDYYKELWTNKVNYIGKYATIEYQNFTPDGIPRFARIKAIRDYE